MILIKELVSKVIPTGLWKWLRTRRILSSHRRIASICENLIENCNESDEKIELQPKRRFDSDKIIWQYWAQGYDDVPDVVRQCLDSVDKYAEGYKVIRLSDQNISDYIEIPSFVMQKRDLYSVAHFSDLLRLMLLSTYGGTWLDATVLLSGPIPKEYHSGDFFMFQRNPQEKNKKYWENTYAYYFGWAEGFRVNVLNSIIFAKKSSLVIGTLASLMLKWWKENDSLPDYFFFQILFDVLIKGEYRDLNCKIVSDTLPHYLQQSINDPKFNLMAREDILASIPVHKLTYK